ncbi:MAG TPA: preprotein translocase subunit SecD, partial [Bacillota bacterium]
MRRRRISATLLLAFFLFLIAAGYYLGVQNPITNHITQGLDLAGGVHVVLQARGRPQAPVTPEAMRTAVEVIRRRVDSLGVAEPVIQQWGDDRIVVDLPGADPQRALDVIGRTAQLEFRDPEGNVILTGANLVRAQAAFGPAGDPVVSLQFDDEGTRAFREATERLVGRPIAIVLDGEILTNPTVREPIPNGEAQISGIGSVEEAQNIAVALSSGALPVELEIIENRSVSALLGQTSVAQSKQAAVYGVLAVTTFMLLVYRLPGLLANAALALYIMILLVALALLDATLTLPGIAGIILSIGMAVDANVLVFERIREEL